MAGAEMEKVMWDFHHRKYDILLATTIIESGLDIPTVNTLIVEEAEDFGLSQLYQLRGRVGRERQRAFCYLFHSPGIALTEEAQKRLTALKEFASLGSGFKLALRDLEIRGAGNLLGPQQHGFVNAVGLDLYGQMLAEEVDRQRRRGVPSASDDNTAETALEIPVTAYLPEDFLPSESERVIAYKRILDASRNELADLRAELEDRCGALPDAAERLLTVAGLRRDAQDKRISRIAMDGDALEFRFRESAELPPEFLAALPARHGSRFSFLPGPPFGFRFEAPLPDDLLPWLVAFVATVPTTAKKSDRVRP
jgi:transcription-repair coupling factor (superfamily II helicase)